MDIVAQDINDLYLSAIEGVLSKGLRSAPRGIPCTEVSPAILQLKNPRARLITVKRRLVNAAYAIAEWLWTMLGTCDGTIPLHYNRKLSFLVTQPPATFEYSYGSRLRHWHGIDQLETAFDRIQEDHETRRAVCVLFDPILDHVRAINLPCINLIQFSLRNNHLDLSVYMRSNDLILGFAYDVFCLSLIQEVMAGWLGCELGKYTHVAQSLHIYKKDQDLAKNILSHRLGSDLYKTQQAPDIRLDKGTFQAVLANMVVVEQLSRENPFAKSPELDAALCSLPTSWQSMAYCLLAYNAHRPGKAVSYMERKESFIRYLGRCSFPYSYLLAARHGDTYGLDSEST